MNWEVIGGRALSCGACGVLDGLGGGAFHATHLAVGGTPVCEMLSGVVVG